MILADNSTIHKKYQKFDRTSNSVVFFDIFWYNITDMGFEYDLIRFLQANATTGWLSFFQLVTMLGSYLGLVITFAIVFAKNKKLSLYLVITFVVGSVINHFLKAIIARERPFDTYADIFNYGNEDGFSMPSGHSLCAGIFATFLIYTLFISSKNRWTRALGSITILLFALLIMLSRMVLGVHYLTDTILGIIVGILFAFLAILIYTYMVKKKK